MKNVLHLFFLAAVVIGCLGCPSTPEGVCFTLPDGSRICIAGQNGSHWIHDDNEIIKLSTVNMDPLAWENYPQFGNALTLRPGEYRVQDSAGVLSLLGPPSLIGNGNSGNNPLSNQIAGSSSILGSTDQEMGFIVLNRGGVISIASAISTSCDMEELQATATGWKMKGMAMGTGITVHSTLLLTDDDGTKLFRREVNSHPTVERAKGTTVVLIDNFMPDLSKGSEPMPACCRPGVRANCPADLPAPGEEDGDTGMFDLPNVRIPSTGLGEEFTTHRRFFSSVSTITLSCERIHLATCNTTETRCYNTMGCTVELWLDTDPLHACGAVITDECTPAPGFKSICGTVIDPNI